MSALPKATDRFNAILLKIPTMFCRNSKIHFENYMEF